ncbi:MAG: Na/Pi cotransporter family protein [Cyanobacteria bacterium REEB65]|nr:Na/Pi cotransporter family protein [Cyanobacteria bacterium REEB65]
MSLFGCTGLLLLGIQLAAQGMQKAAGNRLRAMINTFTTHPLAGLLLGTGITAVMQSSGATTVLLVSFVGSGLLQFEQTIAVLLGANIGTTLAVQLIAFQFTGAALALVGAGFAVQQLSRRPLGRHMGQAVLGFGLVYLAIRLFGDVLGPMQQSDLLAEMLRAIGQDPWLALLCGAVLAAAMNSSAAAIGLALVLATHHLLGLQAAVPLVLGANVGTCVTPFMGSVGASFEARRVVYANAIMKAIGVLLALAVLQPFTQIVASIPLDVARQIAWAHTIFNVALAAIFLPMARPFATFIKRVLPHNPNEDVGFQIRYLDESLLDAPVLALGAANRELRRMADRVQIMMSEVMEVFLKGTEEPLHRLAKLETEVDALTRAIIAYLSALAQHAFSPEDSRKAGSILYIVNDLEHVGDMLTKLASLARRKIENGLEFSPEGAKELLEMHSQVSKNLDMAIVAFMTGDRVLAEKVVDTQPQVARLERDLREHHLGRLWQGIPDSQHTSTIHLDLIYGWQRINDHAVNIAQTVFEYFTA